MGLEGTNTSGNVVYIIALFIATLIIGTVLFHAKATMHEVYSAIDSTGAQATASDNWWNTAQFAMVIGVELILFALIFSSLFGGTETRLSIILFDFILAVLLTAFFLYAAGYITSQIGVDNNMLGIIQANIAPLMLGNIVLGALSTLMKGRGPQ